MTNYTASYDTLGNYEEPIAPIVERASLSQLEEVSSEVPQSPRSKSRLKPRTYSIIGALVLSATIGAACYVNKALNDASQAMMGFQALPGRMIDHLNNSLYEEIWKTTDSDKEKYLSKK